MIYFVIIMKQLTVLGTAVLGQIISACSTLCIFSHTKGVSQLAVKYLLQCTFCYFSEAPYDLKYSLPLYELVFRTLSKLSLFKCPSYFLEIKLSQERQRETDLLQGCAPASVYPWFISQCHFLTKPNTSFLPLQSRLPAGQLGVLRCQNLLT